MFQAFPRRHRSEQNFTSSQLASHFLRHKKGLPHVAHTFCGRLFFATVFPDAFFIVRCQVLGVSRQVSCPKISLHNSTFIL